MASNLKSRLARIKKLGLVKAVDLAGTSDALARSKSRADFLKDWTARADFLWSRTLHYDRDTIDSLDPALFAPLGKSRAGSLAASGKYAAFTSMKGGRIAKETLRFFDLETTGLSGGTGTIAFLASVGRAGAEGFDIEQLFLEDFPGERSFVTAVLELLGDGVVVSYNGKAFDLPLLRTRCVMNAVPVPAPPHVDALFASRRLWKRVHGGASLELLGREVLGLEREEDIPGSMIPSVWLDYARTGEAPLMRLVLRHNADDVLALALLAAKAQSLFDAPASVMASPEVDRAGLGRILLAAGRDEEGEMLLESAAGDGDERAALYAMRRYRLASRTEDCLRAATLLPASFHAAVERAKLHEKLVRDYAIALDWAREALSLAPGEEERKTAARRLRRIERKIERGGGEA
jgi:uncharacterized protein